MKCKNFVANATHICDAMMGLKICQAFVLSDVLTSLPTNLTDLVFALA